LFCRTRPTHRVEAAWRSLVEYFDFF